MQIEICTFQLLEMWYNAAKKNSGLAHCYDAYDEGVVHGMEKVLDSMGILKDQRDEYYNKHR
jgi:hypothetical protein